MLHYLFFQNALLGLIIIAVACALTGTYIVVRRMVFISGGITHASFGGLGLGYYLGFPPLAMAAIFAVASSLGVEWLTRRRARRDSAIAVIWALGMALGVLFISLTPGNAPELNTFLFGNVLTITRRDLLIFLIYTVLLALFVVCFFPTIRAVSFDEDFARTRHLPVAFINTAMTILVAVGIVLTIRLTGIMLLMAILSVPQMTAELFTGRLIPLFFLSLAISLAGSVGGLFAAAAIGVPASAAIVLILIALYLAASLTDRLRRSRLPARRNHR